MSALDVPVNRVEFHRKILYSFSLDYDIRPPGQNTVTGTRWVLSKCIYEWVSLAKLNTVVYELTQYTISLATAMGRDIAFSKGIHGALS